MIPWRTIPAWCHQGERDRFGLCFYAMMGNLLRVQTGQLMPVGEIENAAREMAKFNPYDPATDHGENLEIGFAYIQANGWPGDPTRRITSWRKVGFGDIGDVITELGGAPSWLNLPMTADGEDYDFTDGALDRGAEGVHPHAVLCVDPGLTFPTWGELRTVSPAWARRYFQGFYEVRW